jgi:hypothetical protein
VPVTYADGHRCGGSVYQARAYGPVGQGEYYVKREEVRKYRLWCSEKGDHAGAISSNVSKHRMEFYRNELEPGIEDRIWQDKVLG